MMKKIIKLGQYNTLKVKGPALREGFGEKFGIYLEGGADGDILMPLKYVPEGVKQGDEINCFVYLDQEERPIATTEKPLAQVGDFAWLECSWVNKFGAFLNWGVMKDVFCPFHEMKQKMEIGNSYLVYIYIDEESYRIAASAKVEHFLQEGMPPYHTGDEVDLLVWQKTNLGFKVIVDNKYSGLIYEDQIFRMVHSGDKMKGYIQAVRPDGKLDVALQPTGRKQTTAFAAELLQYIEEHNGYCPYGDKSNAEDIKHAFNVSKKVFKKAIGDLYKQRLITIEPDGLHLSGK